MSRVAHSGVAAVVAAVVAASAGATASESTFEAWRRLGAEGLAAFERGDCATARRRLRLAVRRAVAPDFEPPLVDPFLPPLATCLLSDGLEPEAPDETAGAFHPAALRALLAMAQGKDGAARRHLADIEAMATRLGVRPEDPRRADLALYRAFAAFLDGDIKAGHALFAQSKLHRQRPVVEDRLASALGHACAAFEHRAAGDAKRARARLGRAVGLLKQSRLLPALRRRLEQLR
jgi:hypothetical protein